jgi:anaerobic magnesium-protoporphyrin IX monomethyl ester cyclase
LKERNPVICLIRPPAAEAFRFSSASTTLPLGLAYIAGALRQAGIDVAVVDAIGEGPEVRTKYFKGYLMGLRFEEIVSRIPPAADIIGISVIFTHEWPAIVGLIEVIRRRFAKAAIVLGGEHVTSMPEFSLLTSKADIAVLGEGEETVVELVHAIRNRLPLADIAGIAYRQNGDVNVNIRRNRKADIDSIPTPAWDLFSLQTYRKHRLEGAMFSSRLTIPILATRGCPYQCTYCSAPNMWLPRWVPRDPVKVVDEIEMYVQQYGAGNFPFQDLTAIIQRDWIKAFSEELIRRNLDIQWQLPTGTRSEAIDPEIARLLKQSGMTTMAYAPESGSDETRRLVKKKMTREKLFGSIDAAASAGLHVSVFLVIGFPHDTPDQIAENLPFLDDLARCGVSDVAICFYMALPGTELFRSLYDAGKIKIDKKYFKHILKALAPTPTHSYCDSLGRVGLTFWKFRMYRRFYGANRRGGEGGVAREILRAIRALFRNGDDQTKLETAARHALTTGVETILTWFRPRYMNRRDESVMFGSWDAICRRIQEKKLEFGVIEKMPANTAELHRTNVIPVLVKEHSTPRTITVAG